MSLHLQQTPRDALGKNAIKKYLLPHQVVENIILVQGAKQALQQAKQRLNASKGKMRQLKVLKLLLRVGKLGETC